MNLLKKFGLFGLAMILVGCGTSSKTSSANKTPEEILEKAHVVLSATSESMFLDTTVWTIDKKTKFSSHSGAKRSASDIKPGDLISYEDTGPIAESYPMQGTLRKVVQFDEPFSLRVSAALASFLTNQPEGDLLIFNLLSIDDEKVTAEMKKWDFEDDRMFTVVINLSTHEFEINDSNVDEESSNADVNEVTETDNSMSDFFLPDGLRAHFLGEGNEYAEMDIEVTRLFNHYVVMHVSTTGAVSRQIYKLESDKILTLEQKEFDGNSILPTLDEVQVMDPIGIYLQKPFTEGATFDGWVITETEATVETPYKRFNNALVLERNTDGFVSRRYFVQEIGVVKTEFFQESEGEESAVTSTLESIE